MPSIKKTIEENDKINIALKPLVQECFATLYRGLGKQNFLRWVDNSRFDDKLKTLIVDYMTKDEAEEHKTWAGYFTYSKNKITIRDEYDQSRGTMIHEMDHYLSGNNRLCTYLNEGVTEYIKSIIKPVEPGETEKTNHDAYIENTRTVKWMHRILGDSLIKRYFVGKDNGFDENLAELMGCSVSDVTKFYSVLDKRHDELSDTDKVNSSEFKNDTDYLLTMFKSLAIGAIKKDANNFGFYDKNGKLDRTKIINGIERLTNGFPLTKDKVFLNKFRREALETIIEESYLLMDCPKDQIAAKKLEYFRAINEDDMEVIDSASVDVPSKLFQKMTGNLNDMDLDTFVTNVLKIVENIKMTERERNALISESIIRTFGKDVDIKLIDSFIKSNMGRNQALQEIATDRDRNVIESTFIRIGDINSNTFLEKRDNKYYVVKVNDNGEFVEADPMSLNLFGSVQARNSKGRTEFVVAQRKDKAISVNKVDINLQPELKDVEIDGILVDMNGQTMTTQEFVMYQRIVPLLKEIENKKYYTRIDNGIDPFYGLKGVFFVGPGDVDTRGKEFDFDSLKQELSKIDELYADKSKVELLKQEVARNVLRRTYQMPESEPQFAAAYQIMEDVIFDRLDEEQKKSRLADAYGIMNNGIKENAEENMKYSLVSFESDAVKEEYFKRAEEEKEAARAKARLEEYVKRTRQKQEEKDKFEADKKRVSQTGYYQVIKDEEAEKGKYEDSTRGFGLSGLMLVGGKLDGPGKRKILVEKFVEDITSVTSRMTNPEEIKRFVEDCANTTIASAYQVGKSDLAGSELESQFDFMIQSLVGKTLDGVEIDEEKFEAANELLNENRMQLNTGKLIGFRTKAQENMYKSLLRLQGKLDKTTFKSVAEEVVVNFNKSQEVGEHDQTEEK